MIRLLRVIAALFSLSLALIIIIIASHYSDSNWGCVSFLNIDGVPSTLDLAHGVYYTDYGVPTTSGILSRLQYHDLLIYDYLSSTSVHRIGTVVGRAATDAPHLDFTESDDLFAHREPESLTLKYLPILTYDWVSQTQTMTIYDMRTLVALVSAEYSDVILVRAQYGNFERLPTSWSPNEKWFAFLSPTAQGVRFTLLSPDYGLSRSFPLSGSSEDVTYVWSFNDRAIAISNENRTFADIFVAEDDRWNSVKTYQLRAPNPNTLLNLGYWSMDGRSFYFNMPKTSADEYGFFAFRLDSQRIESAEGEQIDWAALRLNNQWICNQNGLGGILTSLTNTHPPITLADLGLGRSVCNPMMQSPDKTKLVVATRDSPSANILWLGLTSNPPIVKPLLPPANIRQFLAWSPDSRVAFFFAPNVQTAGDYYDGWLGILDTTTWHWVVVNDAVILDQYQFGTNIFTPNVSPDSNRVLVLASDRQQTLMLARDGHVIERLPVAATYPYWTINWSPDSVTVLLTDSRLPLQQVTYLYSRDGQLLATMNTPQIFARWNSIDADRGWTHCEPTLKIPRANLPK